MKKLLLTLLLTTLAAGARSPWTWEVDFDTRFDNREYNSNFAESETLFGTKLAAMAGYYFEGGHGLLGGLDVWHDMGARLRNQPATEYMLWYNYSGRKFAAWAGAFPRANMWFFPQEFIAREHYFDDPVIEGVMLRYFGRRGEIWFVGDWFGKKTATDREQFMLYSNGVLHPLRERREWRVGYYAVLQHFASSEMAEGVVDNVTAKPYIGYQDRHLGVSAGWVQSVQRDRANENKMLTPGGFRADASVTWCGFGIYDFVYLGDDLMPLWSRYGTDLYHGDPFFRTTHGVYNRLEFSWSPRLGRATSLKIASRHHFDGKKWSWQQLATLSIRLNKATLQ